MGLDEYRGKRDLSRTAEPSGEIAADQRRHAALRFFVQKHAARRLHYDFRLEMDGVLKSWALPKGPSLDPGVKRLAVQVEDHPLEYAEFEGVIPEGDPVKAFEHGALKFELRGERLRGGWALVHMGRRRSGNYWLLIKQRDAEARPSSGDAVVAHNLTSVTTGRDIETIAAARDRLWR